MRNPCGRPIFVAGSVKALVRVSLSDSFRIRAPSGLFYSTKHKTIFEKIPGRPG